MKTKITTSFIVTLTLIFASCTSTDTNQIADLAKSWVVSSYKSKEASLSMVSENIILVLDILDLDLISKLMLWKLMEW
jgi:hypothetical protein